jgi:hypothetical protein
MMKVLRLMISMGKLKMVFAPFPDITALQLSEIVSLLFNVQAGQREEVITKWFDTLSPGAKRHFTPESDADEKPCG